MSERNVEIVREVFERFQEGLKSDDPGAAFDSPNIAPDLEWVLEGGFPGPNVYRGRDGFVEFMRLWTEDFAGWTIEVERWIDAPNDRVVGLVHQSATGKGSGVPVEIDLGVVYELERGRVVRVSSYLDRAEALASAGVDVDS